jgi:hypothetical protein
VAVCHFHPGRAGVGVCMRCRVVVCDACCTRLDGVNHCHACLKVMGTRDAGRAAGRAWRRLAGAALLLLAGWVPLFLLLLLLQGWLAP